MSDERRYQVFISSTAHDLKEERQKIWETLVSLDYIVSGMEAFPATNEDQFNYIKQQISQSDYYVLVLAGRYGSTLDDGVSFTEKEFDFALQEKIPSLVFLHNDLGSIKTSKTDQDQSKMEQLKKFRERASRNRLCSNWSTSAELALSVVKSLQAATKSQPRPGWQRGSATDSVEILNELRNLRLENDKLKMTTSSFSAEGAPSLMQDLKRSVSFSYTIKDDSKEFKTIQLSPRAILNEMSIFEPTTFDLFDECVSGAIAARTDLEFTNISVDRAEVDRAILLFEKMGIVRIGQSGNKLVILQGKNWLTAHSDAKLNR